MVLISGVLALAICYTAFVIGCTLSIGIWRAGEKTERLLYIVPVTFLMFGLTLGSLASLARLWPQQ
jgi:TRAP-type C4-dicarboxylate transport system permease small subunit